MNIFCDLSHWNGKMNMALLAALGHKVVVIKASDNYYMPTKEGKYIYDEEHHVDSWFVDNAVDAYNNGMEVSPYHFVRFTKTYTHWGDTKEQTIQKNLDYFQDAISRLPEEYRNFRTVVLDFEEHDKEDMLLNGLTKTDVSKMARAIVDLYLQHFENVIMYSASWWAYDWMLAEDMEYIASKVLYWEAEYYGVRLYDTAGNTIGLNDGGRLPTLPPQIKRVFATDSDYIGNLFAHQFTSSAKIVGYPKGVDMSRTQLSGAALVKLFSLATEEPEEPGEGEIDMGILEDMKADLATALAELAEIKTSLSSIKELIEAGGGNDGGTTEPPPAPGTVDFQTTLDKNHIYLSWFEDYTDTPAHLPIFKFYPSDEVQPATARVSVIPGSVLKVYPTRIQGANTRGAWKLDMTQNFPLETGFLPIPDGVQLYVEERFKA